METFEQLKERFSKFPSIMQAGGIAEILPFCYQDANQDGAGNQSIISYITYIKCHKHGCFCLIDGQERIIVPVGKYSFIDKPQSGHARVFVEDEQYNTKWGIINLLGEEVIPLEYEYIDPFIGEDLETIMMVKEGYSYWYDLTDGSIYDYDPYGDIEYELVYDTDYPLEEDGMDIDDELVDVECVEDVEYDLDNEDNFIEFNSYCDYEGNFDSDYQ